MYFVYALRDPRTSDLRYVGCSANLDERLVHHMSAREDNEAKWCWIQSLRDAGLTAEMEMLHAFESKQDAQICEADLIRQLCDLGCPLLNLQNRPGREWRHTEDAKQRISVGNTGKVRSDDVRHRISNSLSGRSGEWSQERKDNHSRKMREYHAQLSPAAREETSRLQRAAWEERRRRSESE